MRDCLRIVKPHEAGLDVGERFAELDAASIDIKDCFSFSRKVLKSRRHRDGEIARVGLRRTGEHSANHNYGKRAQD